LSNWDWQHPNIHNWLKKFDQLHHRNHINSWSLDKHGAFPHIRAGSQKIYKKVRAPSGLSINAYDPKHVVSPTGIKPLLISGFTSRIYMLGKAMDLM
jgi:hypothetical protein